MCCLRDAPLGADYHETCARQMFGTEIVPAIELELSKLHTVAVATIGHASLSGVQKKISAKLSSDRMTLQVATTDAVLNFSAALAFIRLNIVLDFVVVVFGVESGLEGRSSDGIKCSKPRASRSPTLTTSYP